MQPVSTSFWQCRDRRLPIGTRPLIMGILNVTPDSFSDGGRYADPGAAVARGLAMLEEGADLLDVGGESTRPGAAPVPADEECRRVVPVIRELCRQTGATLSVDTMKGAVAREALAAGARIVNDVAAAAGDADTARAAAEAGAGLVLMHMRGTPRTMQADPRYEDVAREVAEYLAERVRAAEGAGVARACLAVDPGIGFGKTPDHNLALLARLGRLRALGLPVLVGLSRKSFLGRLTGRGTEERLAASLAGLAFAALHGADILRVHDVRESCDAARVIAALRAAGEGAA